MPTTYEPIQEVRFAVVMYGGVSLAIYINGVAQEMLRLVRSTAPTVEPGPEPLRSDEEIQGTTEQVYRDLGRLLLNDGLIDPEAAQHIRQPGPKEDDQKYVLC